jgi:hypothetical protein
MAHDQVLEQCKQHDLARSPLAWGVWGAPAVLGVIGSLGLDVHWWSLTVAGIIWTITVLWVGLGCALNGWRCGRMHCSILALLLPLQSCVGLLKVLGVAFLFWNLPWFWNGYWILFGVLVFLSFVPEWVGKTYLPVAVFRK